MWADETLDRVLRSVRIASNRAPEVARNVLLDIGLRCLKDKPPVEVALLIPKLEAALDPGSAGFLQPLRLGADVLLHGEDKALAREPEEMRRAVRLLLDKVGRETPPTM